MTTGHIFEMIFILSIFFGYVIFISVLSGAFDIKAFFNSISPGYQSALRRQYIFILNAHSNFFNQLTPKGQDKFIKKCSRFISTKRFIGMEGLQITPEMKLRIAATAAQVSYGMSNSAFSHYHTVKIFPESFYSRMHDRYLKGGSSTGGTMYFSWKDFVEGYADPSDRYNLGLHEMAHALRIQLRHGEEFDERFSGYVDQWIELALPEFESMNEGKTSFLREYGGTNMEEFFAVCVEHYFEVPEEFKKQLPDIYNHLAFLLNLDPLNGKNDFSLEPGFIESINQDRNRKPIPAKLSKTYKYADWHWSYSFILAGVFIATPFIIIMNGDVLFRLSHVVLIIAFTTALITSFRNFFHRKGIEYFGHLMFFCVIGAGPLIFSLMLVSNYYITTNHSVSDYPVTGYEFRLKRDNNGTTGYWQLYLKNQAFHDYPEIRSVPELSFTAKNYDSDLILRVKTSKGIWGFDNFESNELRAYQKPVSGAPGSE